MEEIGWRGKVDREESQSNKYRQQTRSKTESTRNFRVGRKSTMLKDDEDKIENLVKGSLPKKTRLPALVLFGPLRMPSMPHAPGFLTRESKEDITAAFPVSPCLCMNEERNDAERENQ